MIIHFGLRHINTEYEDSELSIPICTLLSIHLYNISQHLCIIIFISIHLCIVIYTSLLHADVLYSTCILTALVSDPPVSGVSSIQGPYVNVPVQIKAIESKYPLFVAPRLPSPLFVAPRPGPGTPGGGGGGAAIVGFLCILRILRSPSRPATALCTLDPVQIIYKRRRG